MATACLAQTAIQKGKQPKLLQMNILGEMLEKNDDILTKSRKIKISVFFVWNKKIFCIFAVGKT